MTLRRTRFPQSLASDSARIAAADLLAAEDRPAAPQASRISCDAHPGRPRKRRENAGEHALVAAAHSPARRRARHFRARRAGAEPVPRSRPHGTGPVVIVIDNGWAAADGWQRRTALGEELHRTRPSTEAARPHRRDGIGHRRRASINRSAGERAIDARCAGAAPFAPDRKGTLAALKRHSAAVPRAHPSIVWLADGIDHDASAAPSPTASQLASAAVLQRRR